MQLLAGGTRTTVVRRSNLGGAGYDPAVDDVHCAS